MHKNTTRPSASRYACWLGDLILPQGPKVVLYLCRESNDKYQFVQQHANIIHRDVIIGPYYVTLMWRTLGKTYRPPHPEGESVRDRLESNNQRSSSTTVLVINQWVSEDDLCCAKD